MTTVPPVTAGSDVGEERWQPQSVVLSAELTMTSLGADSSVVEPLNVYVRWNPTALASLEPVEPGKVCSQPVGIS